MGFKFISTKRSSLMKQRVLGLGLSIGILLIGVNVALPGVSQNLPSPPSLGDAEFAEVKQLYQQFSELYRQGKYEEAIPFAKRILTITEKALGEYHQLVAVSLNNVALLYSSQEKYTQAEPLYQRALDIYEKELGKEHREVATSLNNLAGVYFGQGKYTQAESLYQRALAIRKKVLGEDHPDVAGSLNNLAVLYRNQGKYAQAVNLSQQALAIFEKVQGKNHPSIVNSLNNLGELYRSQGKYSQAVDLFKRSLSISKEAHGKNHPDVAISLNNLAEVYSGQGKYAQAVDLSQQALAIFEKVLGKDHPSVGISLNNLGELYRSQGEYAQAEDLFRRSLVISKKAHGENHPSVAISLNNLAELYSSQGKYAQAVDLSQQALAIFEKVLGKDHPSVGISLNNLAALFGSQGKTETAVDFHNRASVITEQQLSKTLFVGSERDKKDYVDNSNTNPNFSITIAIKSNHTDAQRLALTNVLRYQGRILDATAATIQSIRTQLKNRPDLQKLFDDLQATFQEQSALTTEKLNEKNPQAYRARYQELEQRRQQIESQLSAQSAVFRQAIAPVELAKVQALIPQDAALLHVIRYRPYNSKTDKPDRFGSPRYAAAILRSTGDSHWVDLGAAAEIEQNIQTFRAYLQDGSHQNRPAKSPSPPNSPSRHPRLLHPQQPKYPSTARQTLNSIGHRPSRQRSTNWPRSIWTRPLWHPTRSTLSLRNRSRRHFRRRRHLRPAAGISNRRITKSSIKLMESRRSSHSRTHENILCQPQSRHGQTRSPPPSSVKTAPTPKLSKPLLLGSIYPFW
jgi:tetratricopeptide (TPR) repeat protein